MELLDLEIAGQYKDVLGIEVFSETVDLYVEQSQLYIDKLKQAVAEQNYANWQESCHILKSASGNTGLKQVFNQVKELEYSKDDFAVLSVALEKLESLNKESIQAIKKWLTQG
ncbi:Hpt domain-containing protein [Thalassomonas sp. M1454]|uniref:Hpt domain-containing protein n=1 Tax=Thalassomonas sp. M1454 TaxID=2594477 RepID=UPI00163D699E|nr:Hpt domain-containing protein [Thalassomonas sp. M1454]